MRPSLQCIKITGRGDRLLVIQRVGLLLRAKLNVDLVCRLRDDNHLRGLRKYFAHARTVGSIRISTTAEASPRSRRAAVSGIHRRLDLGKLPGPGKVWCPLRARDYRHEQGQHE